MSEAAINEAVPDAVVPAHHLRPGKQFEMGRQAGDSGLQARQPTSHGDPRPNTLASG